MTIQTIKSVCLRFLSIKNRWQQFLFNFAFFMSLSHADSLPPLIVATETFNPPFIMQGANNQLFGFDIEMIEDICQTMHRECKFRPGFFENTVIDNIAQREADLGVASITITLERMRQVSFSFPYLPSDSQYLTLKKSVAAPFSKSAFTGKKIGMQFGTVFEQVIQESGFSNVQIIKYYSTPLLIQALTDGEVDFVLQDALSAQYWATQIPTFATFGEPFGFGYGFGIVVNKNDKELLKQVNIALLEFEKNGHFKKTYNQYISRSYLEESSSTYKLPFVPKVLSEKKKLRPTI